MDDEVKHYLKIIAGCIIVPIVIIAVFLYILSINYFVHISQGEDPMDYGASFEEFQANNQAFTAIFIIGTVAIVIGILFYPTIKIIKAIKNSYHPKTWSLISLTIVIFTILIFINPFIAIVFLLIIAISTMTIYVPVKIIKFSKEKIIERKHAKMLKEKRGKMELEKLLAESKAREEKKKEEGERREKERREKEEYENIPNLKDLIRNYVYHQLKAIQNDFKSINLEELDKRIKNQLNSEIDTFVNYLKLEGYSLTQFQTELLKDDCFKESKPIRDELRILIKDYIEKERIRKAREEQERILREKVEITKRLFGKEILKEEDIEKIEEYKTIEDKINDLMKEYSAWERKEDKKKL